MKRLVEFLLTLCLCVSPFAAPTHADTVHVSTEKLQPLSAGSEKVSVSNPMTFEEMVAEYAKSSGLTYEEALELLPAPIETRAPVTYRTLKATLDVTDSYKPTLDFYCQTSESGNYWGILSVYSVQLSRSYDTGILSWVITKQFNGTVDFWLRSPYEIEYIINGDFFNNGTTSNSKNTGLNIGVSGGFSINFTLNGGDGSSSNHYSYFYEREWLSFQS
ncbi:hypothetical protein D1159_00760 [Pseudoflavonifractor sp. 524-17]|uniref:hypothetical protein n=1 Tax=Pseudoflavonifractor sp. 524-17 TaxID=2304577 RepID=UPI00137B39EB|nr:hypothetical protein [Pseudoflavonifractor sp. 524-17]NCE63143.1 hypothetical protein [Pseudoflavonifractor sp. 524-17]